MQSFPKSKIHVLLLEGIDSGAAKMFQEAGYTNIDCLPGALEEKALIKALESAFIIGIRSRTKLHKDVLKHAQKLFAIGCFCIGTDQVDLKLAANLGIPVFNAPHSNTRSVAELVVGLTVMLIRNIFPLNAALHTGSWQKTAQGAFEVRGKVLGIVGYGHIGTQVSVLAESLGMQVIYCDILSKLPLGNAKQVSFDELLQMSDVVTFHVPDTKETRNMLGKKEIAKMKQSACLINAARGNVVDLDALTEALEEKKIKGAALDVFPKEPQSLKDPFENPLRKYPEVILTPHIGGSTKEAQVNIGQEVSQKLIYFSDRGSTEGAVNFPALTLSPHKDAHRILHIHENIPGMLKGLNDVIAEAKINILGQYLLTQETIGYVVLDLEQKVTEELVEKIKQLPGTIRTRVLY